MTNRHGLGIGLIGLGIGQQHLLGYQRQGLNVAAICDKDTSRLNEVGDTFQIENRYTHIAELIADTEENHDRSRIPGKHHRPARPRGNTGASEQQPVGEC